MMWLKVFQNKATGKMFPEGSRYSMATVASHMSPQLQTANVHTFCIQFLSSKRGIVGAAYKAVLLMCMQRLANLKSSFGCS